MCTLERKEKIITTQNSKKNGLSGTFMCVYFWGMKNNALWREILSSIKKSHRDGSIQERRKRNEKNFRY